MRVLVVRNVCEALYQGVTMLQRHGRDERSRAGPVLVMPCPVTTVYEHPRERVLFSPLRDANPFFHLVEALWMLAGRRDAALLDNFVRDFGERFAETDGCIHDAYGHRWRHALGFDQLDAVVQQLSEKPESRQAVLQMWDAYPDTRYTTNAGEANCGEDDLLGSWRTRPCNTHVYLRIRGEPASPSSSGETDEKVLDLTVLCRSNDAWWGAWGANAVHFSVLQEYLAARLDVGVGTMYQVSNNLHVYREQLIQLAERQRRGWQSLYDDRYASVRLQPAPLVHDAETFDEEVRLLLRAYEQVQAGGDVEDPDSMLGNFHNAFLSATAWPVLMAHRHRRGATGESKSWLEQIDAPDWRAACTDWVERRVAARAETLS